MKTMILAAFLFFIVGCGDVRVDTPKITSVAGGVSAPNKTALVTASPDVQKQIDAAHAAQVHAEETARMANDAALAAAKTSNDARAQVASLREQIAAAKANITDLEAKKKAAETRADELQNQEIANAIRFWSLWMVAGGFLAVVVGFVVSIYLIQPKWFWVAVAGGAVAVLGLTGVWLAPHWLLVARFTGVALCLGAVAALVWLIHKLHLTAAESSDHADRLKNEMRSMSEQIGPAAQAAFAEAYDRVKATSIAQQTQVGVRGLIDRIRGA